MGDDDWHWQRLGSWRKAVDVAWHYALPLWTLDFDERYKYSVDEPATEHVILGADRSAIVGDKLWLVVRLVYSHVACISVHGQGISSPWFSTSMIQVQGSCSRLFVSSSAQGNLSAMILFCGFCQGTYGGFTRHLILTALNRNTASSRE